MAKARFPKVTPEAALRKRRQWQRPDEYGHRCGVGQLATFEQPEERASESNRVQYGHHCGAGQVVTYEERQLSDGTRRCAA